MDNAQLLDIFFFAMNERRNSQTRRRVNEKYVQVGGLEYGGTNSIPVSGDGKK